MTPRRHLACGALIAALLAGAASVGAQEGQRPERERQESARQQALERLRSMDRSPLDAGVPADTLVADTLDTAPPGPVSEVEGGPRQVPAVEDRRPDVPPDVEGAAQPGVAAIDSAPVAPGGSPPARSAPSDEAVRAALRELTGYAITEYEGERARFETRGGRLELEGQSEVRRPGQSLATDSLLVFEDEAGLMCGYGNPRLSGAQGEPVESAALCYNVTDRVGVATGARTTFSQAGSLQGTWYVQGRENRVFTVEDDRLYAENTNFTSCDLPHPHYSFRAGKVKMIADDVIVARNVTLNFEDVPVFWLPFMMQSLKQGRRSGILTPEFGLNDVVRNSSNFQRRLSNLGFYWAINDYMGSQVAMEWYSDNWTAVDARLDYRSLRHFLDGNLTVKRFWRTNGSKELTLSGNNSWQMDERTQIQVNGMYASSSDFIVQNTFDPRELNRRITSNASMTRRFDWGRMSLGASRSQQLTSGRVETTLPEVSLSLSPVTLFENPGPDARFWQNLTWNASGNLRAEKADVDELDPGRGQRDQDRLDGNVSNSFRLGSFNLSQRATLRRVTEGAVPAFGDSVLPLPETTDERVTWSTSLGYQQTLLPGTTLTPSLALSGEMAKIDTLGGDFVSAPTRLNFGANLSTNLYGFLPGFGPFSRLRHRVSPGFNYTYSPTQESTDIQREVFGRVGGRETNALSISLSQTFEAKYDEEAEAEGGAEAASADTLPADSAALLGGEPRRLPQARKVMLLSVNTNALVFDFAQEEEDNPLLTTPALTNSFRSDLLRGFQLTVGHDLFEEVRRDPEDPSAGTVRSFDPHLSRINASFSLDNNFFLLRLLGLGTADGETPQEPTEDAEDLFEGEDPVAGSRPLVGGQGPRPQGPTRSAVGGGWRASVDYSLIRPRDAGTGFAAGRENNQMIRGNMSFEPTEHWSVRWATGYSVTDGEFSDHTLTLTRDLHRWQANFDLIKAQNGNFALRFRVHLLDNPDLKFDYDQRSDPVRSPQQ